MLSQTEENYLKVLFNLTNEIDEKIEAGTNEVASYLNVTPATANDMLKKLKKKQFVKYEKYGKISLTKSGRELAVEVIRKHRLWETFLYEKLEFSWDEVHEVAEQLEHIKSNKLILQLEKFLNFPKFDPHGDPIPNINGEINLIKHKTLSQIPKGMNCKLIAVKDRSTSFLQYAIKIGLRLSINIFIVNIHEFDGSIDIEINNKISTISSKFAENLYVTLK